MSLVESVESSRLIGVLAQRLQEAVPDELGDERELAREDGEDHSRKGDDDDPARRGVLGVVVEERLERVEPHDETRRCDGS